MLIALISYKTFFQTLINAMILLFDIFIWGIMIKLYKMKSPICFNFEYSYPDIKKFNNFLFLYASKSFFQGYKPKHCLADPRFNTTNFRISTSFRDYNKANVVIFHQNDFDFRKLPQSRPKGQLWVWLNMEPPQHIQILNTSENQFNYTASYKTSSDIFLPYGYFIKKPDTFVFNSSFFKPFNQRKKLVCWMVSNWRSKFRNEYYYKLNKSINIEVFGTKTKRIQKFHKCDALSDCKFYLSFENTNHTDYITEKIWYNAFVCGAIPIVHGTLKKEYLKQNIPSDSFIHTDDFANTDELAKYIHKVDQNKTLYQSYFNWRRGRDIYFEDPFGTYYCRVVDFFNRRYLKPRKNLRIKEWFFKGWEDN